MRLLKSQVDQVDSPPSAGLTTNQYESRLIAVNSHMRDMRSSHIPTGCGICGMSFNSDKFDEFKKLNQGQCVLQPVQYISENPPPQKTVNRVVHPSGKDVFR